MSEPIEYALTTEDVSRHIAAVLLRDSGDAQDWRALAMTVLETPDQEKAMRMAHLLARKILKVLEEKE
jgi:hypothetical protein